MPVRNRFDYLTIDEDDHYLISAHLAAEQTYVIDSLPRDDFRGATNQVLDKLQYPAPIDLD